MIFYIKPDLSSIALTDDLTKQIMLPGYNPETMQAFATTSEVENFIVGITNPAYLIPTTLTPEEITSVQSEHNAYKAQKLLGELLWFTDPNFVAKVTNLTEFNQYKQDLETIVATKPTTVETWPAKPQLVLAEAAQ